jgi:cell wall-associated NlpC family hydrolase
MRRKITLRTLFLLLSFVFLSAVSTSASVSYTVKKGDNLSRIAKKYKISVHNIESANPRASKNLKPGLRIVIPVREAAAKTNGKTSRDVEKIPAASKAGKRGGKHVTLAKEITDNNYHTVKKGETIASIAKKYSVAVSELKEMNNLKSSKVKKGQKLLVKQIGPKTYIVKKGDTLWKIAKKFDMEADDLAELNELASPDVKAGQKLYLEEKVEPSIAENYHEVVAKNIEEEIRQVSESEEFSNRDLREKLTIFAKKMLNIPYKFGGNNIMGIDCSAYVKKVYGLMGVDLPRTARQQFNEGEAIDKDELSIGDLVFFKTYASFPSHVGIYLGNNLFIHASSRGKKVTIDSLETPYYLKRFIGGKRLLTERGQEPSAEGPLGG